MSLYGLFSTKPLFFGMWMWSGVRGAPAQAYWLRSHGNRAVIAPHYALQWVATTAAPHTANKCGHAFIYLIKKRQRNRVSIKLKHILYPL